MKIESAGGTHVGKIRVNNEDNFYINGYYKKDVTENIKAVEDNIERQRYTYAICDGMGGESLGELASLRAVQALSVYDSESLQHLVTAFVDEANQEICKEIEKNHGKRMGTTLAMLIINHEKAEICNIGDSRVYQLRNARLKQLSQDHTRVQNMVEVGIISREEAKNNKLKNILTQHLGIFPNEFIIEPYIRKDIILRQGDLFLLCSDGITDMITDCELEQLLIAYKEDSPKKIVHELVCQALKSGGKDNISAIVVKIL